MDGMHRVVKALRAGQTENEAVRFTVDPPPDYLNVGRSSVRKATSVAWEKSTLAVHHS
jgi:hypothetical protein